MRSRVAGLVTHVPSPCRIGRHQRQKRGRLFPQDMRVKVAPNQTNRLPPAGSEADDTYPTEMSGFKVMPSCIAGPLMKKLYYWL